MWVEIAATPHWAWAVFFTSVTFLVKPTAYIETYRAFRWWGHVVWMQNSALSPAAYRAQVLADIPKREPARQTARAVQATKQPTPTKIDLNYQQALRAARKAITEAEYAREMQVRNSQTEKYARYLRDYFAVAHPTPDKTYIKRIERP